jgi:AAA family ATP:ADP antiporter
MAKNRLHSILSSVVDIKPGEVAVSLFFFFYFFLITAPYYIIKPIRNASYLDRLGDERLPLAYLLTAIIMGLIVNLHSRLQVRLPRHRLVIFSLIFFLSNISIFWWLFQRNWAWVPTVFWVWANIFAVVLVTQFWILVNDVFNPREAKRLIGFIGSGGILGAILGSLLAGILAKTDFFKFMLLLAAGMLGLGILAVYRIFRWQRSRIAASENSEGQKTSSGSGEKMAKVGFRAALETTRKSRYLILLAGIMTVTWVVSTLIDWQFNSIVSGKVQNFREMTSFFGYFNAGTNAFAFLFQLLLTSRIIRSFGIRPTLLIYPLALLFFSTGIGVLTYASILPAILIKASDKSLAYSLNQSVRELLYIPISPEQKYRSKIFIDMFLNRFAKGIGAVILMILLFIFPARTMEIRAISLTTMILILGWILLNLRAGREYSNLVKRKLPLKWERADGIIARKLDLDYTKLVFDTVESKSRSSILYAMHLFDLIRQDKMTPEVKKLISDKSGEIRAACLGTLMEQGEMALGPDLDDNLDEETLKKEVAEIVSLDVYQEVMKDFLERILQNPGECSEVTRMEAAKGLGFMDPRAPLVEKIEDLLDDKSSEVSRYAIKSAAELGRKEDVPILVRKLGLPVLQADAEDALAKFGGRIAGTLADHLADDGVPPEVRNSVAAVLARIGTQEAADFLSWELSRAEGELGSEIIDALDRIRAEKPGIRFAVEIIKTRIIRESLAHCRRLVRFHDDTDKGMAAIPLSGRETEESLRDIFKLLGLVYPQEDMLKAYQNLKTGTRDSVAYAIELLDTVLEKDLRDVMFSIIEDLSVEERVRRCRHLLDSLEERKRRG